ncbi:MAG: DNA repair and recombination protein RadA [Candidatus Micrarchaeota archaeon]
MKGENASLGAPADFEVEEVGEEVRVKPAKKKVGVESEIKDIRDLPGIGAASAAKLKEAGYEDVETIAYALPAELAEVAGLGDATAQKAIAAARKALKMDFETGVEALRKREQVECITTGSKELDGLMGGRGLETQAITEVHAKFGSGKSQLGFQFCVNAQLPKDKGGLESGVIFIDSEGTFRPERIKQMAIAKGFDPENVLANIFVARAYNSDHQMLLAEKAEEIIKEKNVKLVVVDSVTSHFRSDYIGRGALANRQQLLNKHLHQLLRMAEKYNVAVYVTNQVMANPGILFGDPTTPIGGHVLAHIATYRIYFRRSKEDKRIARMVDSPNMADAECVFRVTENGIGD